jgi:hypothetical protein
MLALIQRFGRKIKLETIGQGAYDTNGNWVRGPKVQVDIIASVQPLTPDELQRLPENQSNREAVKIYTTTKIVVASDKTQKNSDVLVIDGRRFEVFAVTNFVQPQAMNITYYRADAILEDEVI